MNECHVAMICDDGFAIPTAVALQTLRETQPGGEAFVVHIVTPGLSIENRRALSALSGRGQDIDFVEADLGDLPGLHKADPNSICSANTTALLKFRLPELLHGQERVLYLDGDVLVRAPLRPLYETPLRGHSLAAVRDSGTLYFRHEMAKRCPNYFNSGVMVLDLAKMRREKASERLVRAKRDQDVAGRSRFMDQNAFNLVFQDDVELLPIRWNLLVVNLERARDKWTTADIRRVYGATYADWSAMRADAAVWHFSSKDKPWKYEGVFGGEDWMAAFHRLPMRFPEPVRASLPDNPLEDADSSHDDRPRFVRVLERLRGNMMVAAGHSLPHWMDRVRKAELRATALEGQLAVCRAALARDRAELDALAPVRHLVRHPGIDRVQADWEMEHARRLGLRGVGPGSGVVVSLTSYPARIHDVHYAVHSLLSQTEKPERVVLWLAGSQFPNGEADIPEALLSLRDRGLEIRFCEDWRSYTKLIPALKAFPDKVVVTADDDVVVPSGWLEVLLAAHRRVPDAIWGTRGRRLPPGMRPGGDGRMAPYAEWQMAESLPGGSLFGDLFLSGVGGILYPPGALDAEVFDWSRAMALAPTADDIWFWAMARKRGTMSGLVSEAMPSLRFVNPEREARLTDQGTLWTVNKTQNDAQLQAVMEAFGWSSGEGEKR